MIFAKLPWPFTNSRTKAAARRAEYDQRWEEEEWGAAAGPSSYRHATADFTEADDDEDDDDEDDNGDEEDPSPGDRRPFLYRRRRSSNRLEPDGTGDSDEDDRDDRGLPRSWRNSPFSTTHIDSLPIYGISHTVRVIVQARTETSLTWEQLRSPQVSQFLIKPMLQQIRTQHFSLATLYAVMANCLQFAKEGQLLPGNALTCNTRARVCELLAIKLLKEYDIHALIHALSYDFYPLQGLPDLQARGGPAVKPPPVAMRTSTLEVAIRASAKHFLAHPLVVQHLEAIWNGAISFYAAADHLHRRQAPVSAPMPAGPSQARRQSQARAPLLPKTTTAGPQQAKEEHIRFQSPSVSRSRKSVTLYDPRNASVFKLSRLRVPRYRQFLSTCSLVVLIGLFLAVLVQRSSKITSLELIFWFWSASFLLDELITFTEQGFALYMMSFWNVFDLGILLLLVVYYCLRVLSVFMVLDPRRLNDSAYDVLAANAILLLPRCFSLLDHYQYFSQLLIGFRLMAVDLAAVFVLIAISCSGFFVFFTLSKNTLNDPGLVAYKIFQILMGFTPAAWDVWADYDWMGKALMGLFLIISHFVVVTILLSVLTNSFMSIASNANEEHQFLFAINTISMVKDDALFAYVAPGNIIAWALAPLRFGISLRSFVWLNRLAIKMTHFPILLCIFVYEKYFLAPSMYEPTDLVENPPRGRQRILSFADPDNRGALFSPSHLREESVVTFQKSKALDDLFSRQPHSGTWRTQRRHERRKTQNAIRSWMDQQHGAFNSPVNYSTMDSRVQRDWQDGVGTGGRDRAQPTAGRRNFRRLSAEVRSTASDPADLTSIAGGYPTRRGVDYFRDGISRVDHQLWEEEGGEEEEEERGHKDATDAEADLGDDELVTNDEDDEEDLATIHNPAEEEEVRLVGFSQRRQSKPILEEEDYFTRPPASRFRSSELNGETAAAPGSQSTTKTPISPPRLRRREALHNRTLSTSTILYAPQEDLRGARPQSASSASVWATPLTSTNVRPRPPSSRQTPAQTPSAVQAGSGRGGGGGGVQSPRRTAQQLSRSRPAMPSRETAARTALKIDIPGGGAGRAKGPGAGGGYSTGARRRSSVDLDASSELNAALMGDDALGAVPSSFVTQMAIAMAHGFAATKRRKQAPKNNGDDDGNDAIGNDLETPLLISINAIRKDLGLPPLSAPGTASPQRPAEPAGDRHRSRMPPPNADAPAHQASPTGIPRHDKTGPPSMSSSPPDVQAAQAAG